MMLLLSCPTCGKTILVSDADTKISCPYCGVSFDAATRRNENIEAARLALVAEIRSLIDEKDYEEASAKAFYGAKTMDAKAEFFTLVLWIDLLRRHAFFFDSASIEMDVKAVVSSADFESSEGSLSNEYGSLIVRSLNDFFDETMGHFKNHKAVAGERYDTLSRLVYVGTCCRLLQKLGFEASKPAASCIEAMTSLCSGNLGDVYNMPQSLYDTVSAAAKELGERFGIVVSLKLQSRPPKERVKKVKEKRCPVCGKQIMGEFKDAFITCPHCRRRIPKEKAEETFEAPLSLEDKLGEAKAANDIPSMLDISSRLISLDSGNDYYALMKLVSMQNEITPLRLHLGDYVKLIGLASKAKGIEPNAWAAQKKAFVSIRECLAEYVDKPNGPSPELIDALDVLIASLD